MKKRPWQADLDSDVRLTHFLISVVLSSISNQKFGTELNTHATRLGRHRRHLQLVLAHLEMGQRRNLLQIVFKASKLALLQVAAQVNLQTVRSQAVFAWEGPGQYA